MARGRIVIDAERCKGCELCKAACPKNVIQMADSLNEKGYRPAILLNSRHECTGCGLCAVVCPDACITVYREVSIRTARIKKEVGHHVQATT